MRTHALTLAAAALASTALGASLPPPPFDPPACLSRLAHTERPTDPNEVKYIQSLEEKMYACAPKIAKYQAIRKRNAQQVLSGGPASTNTEDLFLDQASEHDVEDTLIARTLLAPLTEEPRIRNHSCILAPQLTEGPYYHTEGHPIRQNMAEDQLGLPFYMDVGVIDVNTCEPLENALVDLWHANTTGHYAGHPEQDPELKWEGPATSGPRKGLLSKYPRTNDHETFLRAAWPTNKNGLAQFSSIFPGYYTGRATHVHVRIHTAWEPLANGTFTSSRMIHTGQFFVPDSLNMQIDKIWPYNTNPIADKWGRTRNWVDSLDIYHDAHGNGYNPEFEVLKVGSVIQQGLIGYITVGVDTNAEYDINAPWKPRLFLLPLGLLSRLSRPISTLLLGLGHCLTPLAAHPLATPATPPSLLSAPLMASTPIHLCVILHGLWGSPSHVSYLSESLTAHARFTATPGADTDEEPIRLEVLVSKTNGISAGHLYDGIDVCAERVVEEIDEEVRRLEGEGARVERFSIVGYSLGGLVARYVLGLLDSRTPSFFSVVQPINFTTFASPWIGIPAYDSFWSRTFRYLGGRLLSRTGRQLYERDRFLPLRFAGELEKKGARGEKEKVEAAPLLKVMADPRYSFYKALRKFERIDVFANIVNDRTVPFPTGALESHDPFALARARAQEAAEERGETSSRRIWGARRKVEGGREGWLERVGIAVGEVVEEAGGDNPEYAARLEGGADGMDESVDLRKHLVLLDAYFSHGAIVCRDRNFGQHQQGKEVVDWWAREFVV
uniref:BY PROTMAP: gi/342321440/gb/EGU13374.1/ ADP-ribose pyrophosphatase [Rhodotorula glutinis ATCC 204091] n=1 Tax=Rhodotorula toruloides TaxID=5286 RepID=A0A0K3C7C1_RHOTO